MLPSSRNVFPHCCSIFLIQVHTRRALVPTRWKAAISRRSFLSPAVSQRLETLVARHKELLATIEQSPEDAFTYGKELASLAHAVSLHEKRISLDAEEISLRELQGEADGDAEMLKECALELERVQAEKDKLEKRIKTAILPHDENDYKSDAIVEIRAGTGGDEASLFASELRDSYEKTAKAMRWDYDVMNESKTDLGGIKEVVFSISSKNGGSGGMMFPQADEEDESDSLHSSIGPYGLFKFESGVHRVQRVPVNDTRIHTSACSVAVLPSSPNSESNANELLPMSELRIETMRSSGAGGQHVNTTDSAVRVTHIPTGITASIQDARSQHKNKDKALKLIAARVRDLQREEEERALGETRSSLMGGGDRSERIRTYNYPQDRITDHRCKHTTHGISKLLDGSAETGLVAEFFPHLRDLVREEQMKDLEQEEQRGAAGS